MKHIFCFFFLFMCCSVWVQAQISITPPEPLFGIKMSYGAVVSRSETTYVGNEDDFLIYTVGIESTKPVWQIGMFSHKKIGYLFVQGDLLLSSYGNRFKVQDYTGATVPEFNYEETFHYIDFQVLGGIHDNGFRIGVGPVFHILADHKSNLEVPGVYKARLRPLSFGFSGEVGYELGNLLLGLKFETAFRSVGDHIYYGPLQSKFKGTPDMLTLNVAYGF